MNIISHRGNIVGPNPGKENRPSYIDCAISSGLDVEVDLRLIGGELWLGHDTPDYKVTIQWIIHWHKNLWIHCKNLEASQFLFSYKDKVKYFCHTNDSYVLTSSGHIWAHDLNLKLDGNCIIPLLNNYDIFSYSGDYVHGICTDYVTLCKNVLRDRGIL